MKRTEAPSLVRPDPSVPHAFVENNRAPRILNGPLSPSFRLPPSTLAVSSRLSVCPSIHPSICLYIVVRAIFSPWWSRCAIARAFRPTFQLVPRYCYRARSTCMYVPPPVYHDVHDVPSFSFILNPDSGAIVPTDASRLNNARGVYVNKKREKKMDTTVPSVSLHRDDAPARELRSKYF